MTVTKLDLLCSSTDAQVTHKDQTALRLEKIRRGFYLPLSSVPESSERWQIRQDMTRARIFACALSFPEDSPALFTGESAMVLHGLAAWWNTSDVVFRRTGATRTGRKVELPAHKIHGVDVIAVEQRQLLSRRLSTGSEEVAGVHAVSLAEAAVDLARFWHPLPALVGVSAILRKLSEYDKFLNAQGRRRELEAREEMLRLLNPVQGTRCAKRAHAVLTDADAGVDNPAEGYMVWALKCLFPASVKITTQQEVIFQGRRYFLDAAIPSLGVGFEFDGAGKILVSRDQPKKFLQRQNDLRRAGWTIIRITTDNLHNPNFITDELSAEIRMAGLPSTAPQGPLWVPPTAELVGPERRF